MMYRVHMESRPAIGRTFYDGHVDVHANDEGQAIDEATAKAAKVHGHRDWHVIRVEVVRK
jgi:hypothetical protein